jgi:outer membrane protein OmpA-like peptidoglycan-associated protein/tetratricopeptide (TPR) repeat protein
MKRKLFLFSLFICITSGFAQQKLKKADKLFADLAYVDAAKAYEEYLEDAKSPGTETIMRVADSYYYTSNNASALRWYTKLNTILGDNMDDVYFNRYLQTLRSNEEYKKADEVLKKRLEIKGDKKQIEKFLSQKKYLDSINAATSFYTVNNLSGVNSDKSDFGATFYGNQMVFSSSKDTTKVGRKLYSWNDQPYLELYVADRNASDGSLFNEKKFMEKEQTRYHNATVAFMPDLKTVYYAANTVKPNDKLITNKQGTGNFEIIRAEINGEEFSKVQKLPFDSKDYSVGHPALSADGKWLFFASDMPGGYGQTDIYVAQVFDDGHVGDPKNLGDKINTAGREMFPFANDSILYFSSDGHYGMGGLDIFESRLIKDTQFSEPKNLGKPVNSNLDDFSYIIDTTRTFGYLSSNRKGGKGDDDIYYFTRLEPPCKQIVSGKVTDVKDNSPLAGATVKATSELEDVIKTVKTNKDGTYSMEVPCKSKLSIEASIAEFKSEKKDLETSKKMDEETKNFDFALLREFKGDTIDVKPIYFDFDKYAITPKAVVELERVVAVMQKYPNIVIKIESHTDSRGKAEYNKILSDNRAKSTRDYIISRGIDAARIESAIGYGEERLKNGCSDGVICTDEQHDVNRRSDFIVVRGLPEKVIVK